MISELLGYEVEAVQVPSGDLSKEGVKGADMPFCVRIIS